jgi:Arc/MetJ-type ribon-helix-helix transcriptional regulator
MGRINIDIPDDLERELRLKAVRKFGGKRGSLGQAITEAVRLWLKQRESSPQKK